MRLDVGVTCISIINKGCNYLIKQVTKVACKCYENNHLMNFHIFSREEPEMVEALDIEEGGDEDY